MSSRQEEKEQRRLERQAAEAAEAKAAGRLRMLQLGFGAILAVGMVVGILFGTGVVGGDDKASTNGGSTPSGSGDPRQVADQGVTLPEQAETDVEKAAKAAGCELIHAKYEGAGHEEKAFKISDFGTNPPTSGQHFPEWADDAIYPGPSEIELGMLVHSLEHGRINLQYKPGTDAATIKALEQVLFEKTGYHALLYENGTEMPFQIAATAWTQLLGCNEYNDKTADALRTFYDRYVDKGPEQVP